jgi:threonine/homoserine/homoserine lactone efflux protein
MVGALAMGLSRFLKGDSFIGTVGLIGGAILTWMGASAFRQARENPSRLDDSVPIGRVKSLLINGAAVTLVNPYWFMWWFSAGLLQVLNGAKAGIAGIAAFYFGHISADFLWLGAVGFLVGWRRDLFRGKIYHRTIQTFASVLILFGLLFIGYGGILIHSAVTR